MPVKIGRRTRKRSKFIYIFTFFFSCIKIPFTTFVIEFRSKQFFLFFRRIFRKTELISLDPNVFSLDPINTSYNTPTLVRHIMSWINNENSWRRWYKLGKICAAAITHRSRSSKKIIIQLPSSNVQWSFQQICPIFFFNIVSSICRWRKNWKYNVYIGNFFPVKKKSVKKIYLTIVLD